MIASMASAVLPVWRSPMMSCRWPLPIAVLASIALSPVWGGWLPSCRWTTLGACTSRKRRSVALISPLPSTGRPSGSTTRPRNSSPTGTERISPVRLTGSPSSMPTGSPRRTHAISRTSRLRATPSTPPGNSSSSLAMADGSPSTRAIPSPASVTRPTSSRVARSGRYDSTYLRSASRISSDRIVSSDTVSPHVPKARLRNPWTRTLTRFPSLILCPNAIPLVQIAAGLLELPAEAAVDQLVADPDDHTSHDGRILQQLQIHRTSLERAERLAELLVALRVERRGGPHLGDQGAARGGGLLGEALDRPLQQAPARVAHDVADQVHGHGGGSAVEQGVDHRDAALQGHPRVVERQPQVRLGREHPGEAEQLVLDVVELALSVGDHQHRVRPEQLDQVDQDQRPDAVAGHLVDQLDGGLVGLATEQVVEQRPLGLRFHRRV